MFLLMYTVLFVGPLLLTGVVFMPTFRWVCTRDVEVTLPAEARMCSVMLLHRTASLFLLVVTILMRQRDRSS